MKRAWSRKGKALALRQEKNRIINLPRQDRLIEEKKKWNDEVKQGNKAKMLAEFVDSLLADAENLALARLADVNGDLHMARADYRAALALYQKVQNVIYQGKVAEDKLKSFKEREGK